MKQILSALKETPGAFEISNNEGMLVNHELIRHKGIVEKNTRSILSSLRYARDMQNAIMPNPRILQSLFLDSFI